MPSKPFAEPLRKDWARSLLSDLSEDGCATMFERLLMARSELETAVREANEQLQGHPLTVAVAKASAVELHKRGAVSIEVQPDGVILLIVTKASPKPREGVRQWESELPSLDTLRRRAQDLGIDPKPLGRAKRLILAAIQEKETQRPPRRVKTAPAIGPVVEVDPASLTLSKSP